MGASLTIARDRGNVFRVWGCILNFGLGSIGSRRAVADYGGESKSCDGFDLASFAGYDIRRLAVTNEHQFSCFVRSGGIGNRTARQAIVTQSAGALYFQSRSLSRFLCSCGCMPMATTTLYIWVLFVGRMGLGLSLLEFQVDDVFCDLPRMVYLAACVWGACGRIGVIASPSL